MSSGFALVLYTLHQIFVLSCGIVDKKVSLNVCSAKSLMYQILNTKSTIILGPKVHQKIA